MENSKGERIVFNRAGVWYAIEQTDYYTVPFKYATFSDEGRKMLEVKEIYLPFSHKTDGFIVVNDWNREALAHSIQWRYCAVVLQ